MTGLLFNNLTFARFIAALFVYLHHSSKAVFQSITLQPLLHFFKNGYVGISFFFIVSGFVLSASNLGKLERFSMAAIAAFYIDRIASPLATRQASNVYIHVS